MTREWKPGDVAMGVADEGRMFYVSPGRWVFDDGTRSIPTVDYEARPLVVIDPEDREQVERLVTLLDIQRSIHDFNTLLGPTVDTAQVALREFADPRHPKPDEPTGLGAVVEVSNGDLYVRDKTTTTHAHWKRARGQEGGARHRYSDLAVVRVLSEGVSA